jgi:hypothetical protein
VQIGEDGDAQCATCSQVSDNSLLVNNERRGLPPECAESQCEKDKRYDERRPT